MRTAALLCCLLLHALPLSADKPAALSSAQWKEVRAQLAALLTADEAKRAELRQALLARPAITRGDAQKLTRHCFGLARQGFRIPRGSSFQIKIGSRSGTVHVSGSGGPGKGLFIGLHGGGRGIGDGKNAQQMWQGAVGAGCVCLFPTVLPDKTWSGPAASRYVNALIDAAQRTWGIDTNRVYLAGHSMGGFGTWMNGCHRADRFAAISSGAGGGYGKGVPRNLFNTPIYFYHSTDDKRVGPASDQANAKELAQFKKEHPGGYTHVYQEYTDIGHGLPKTGLAPIIKWLAGHRRNPYPKKLIWEARDDLQRQFAWLYSEKPESHGLIVARLAGRNRIEITCRSAEGLSVLLSPKMVDFSKPLAIAVNGKQVHSGTPAFSAWAVAVSVLGRNDARQYFLGHVRLGGEAVAKGGDG